MLTQEQKLIAQQIRKQTILLLDSHNYLGSLYQVTHMTYNDLVDIYHCVNTIIMFNRIPIHQCMNHKTLVVFINAGLYNKS